jgi:hypothetical protein
LKIWWRFWIKLSGVKRRLFNVLAVLSTACFLLREISGAYYAYTFYNSSAYVSDLAVATANHVAYHPFIRPTAILFAHELLWSVLPVAWLVNRVTSKRVLGEKQASFGRKQVQIMWL